MRENIEKAIVNRMPVRVIGTTFQIGWKSVQNHKKHLPATLVSAHESQEIASADRILARLQFLSEQTLEIFASAKASGDLRTALWAIREERSNLEFLVRLMVEIQARTDRQIVHDYRLDELMAKLFPEVEYKLLEQGGEDGPEQASSPTRLDGANEG